MEYKVRRGCFFQRGAERLHQIMGQLVDEANGIRQQYRCTVRQHRLPYHRVQGGKQHILRHYPRPCKGIEQGGLAGVGISHQRNKGHGILLPLGAP